MGLPEIGDFVKDLAGDVKSTWLERVSNPMIGALSLSWIAVNYKAFFVLFSSSDYKTNFAYIDNILYPDPTTWLLKVIAIPCVAAAFYIYVVPFPGERVYEWTLKRKRRLAIAEQKAAGEQVLTVNKAAELSQRVKAADERAANAQAEVDGILKAHEIEIRRNADAAETNQIAVRTELESVNADLLAQLAAIKETARSEIARFKHVISNQRWRLTILEAFQMAESSSAEAIPAMRKFLTSRPFVMSASPKPGSSLISFKPDGSVIDEFDGGGVQWRLVDHLTLTVIDEEGKVFGQFSFNVRERIWRGYYGGIATVVLEHEDAEAPHETERDILQDETNKF